MKYNCHGYKVLYSQGSIPPRSFRDNGEYAREVQQALDAIELGEVREKSEITLRFPAPILPTAVLVESGVERTWGVHINDKSHAPRLAPFVDQWVPPEQMGYITLQVKRLQKAVLVTRIYGGHPMPPVPQVASLAYTEVMEYWLRYAYLSKGLRMIISGTVAQNPPHWFEVALRRPIHIAPLAE